MSTYEKVIAARVSTLSKNRNVPPYVFSETMTWSPALSIVPIAPIAAMPDANANPAFPPSIAAMFCFEREARRILRARVLVALVHAELVLHVGGCLIDRRDDGAGGGVRLLAGVQADGAESRVSSGASRTRYDNIVLLISRSPSHGRTAVTTHAAGARDRRRRRGQARWSPPCGSPAAAVPAFVGVIDTVAGLAIAAGAAYFLVQLFLLAKRRLLWRVRRKLILSYIFIGFVPAILIVAFFLLGALLLFFNFSSYLVQTEVRVARRAGAPRRDERRARDSAGRRTATLRGTLGRMQAGLQSRVSRIVDRRRSGRSRVSATTVRTRHAQWSSSSSELRVDRFRVGARDRGRMSTRRPRCPGGSAARDSQGCWPFRIRSRRATSRGCSCAASRSRIRRRPVTP